MTTLAEATDIHPTELVTVKVYVPCVRSEIMVVVPVPDVVTPPGLRVNVQVPVDGNKLNATLPVTTEQVGGVIVPTNGAVGVAGCGLMPAPVDDTDVQPSELVTVKVYVPGGITEIVVVAPLPVVVTPPGLRVTVQLPVNGKPLNATLPVPTEHVGWVIAPTTGTVGVTGCAGIITSFDSAGETHPAELETEKLYVPVGRPEMVVLVPVPLLVTVPG
jgi:hypothetical protein